MKTQVIHSRAQDTAMNRLLAVLILMLNAAMLPAHAAPPVERIEVDFSREVGRIKAIHGVNGGPVSNGENPDLSGWFKEAGFATVRTHDCHWPCPDVIDIHTIFPLDHLDPEDPKNYTFAKTDAYIAGILKTGAKVVFRLGESIETKGTRYHINPPKDMDKFARVCVNVMRHYNEGWANGRRYNIEYWEIWNEPDNRSMWTGTMEEYFTLYETVARAIKSHNPKMKVGGPALAGDLTKKGWALPFLALCRDRKLPLDFFSFHGYTVDVVQRSREARKLLDEYGFAKTEAHLNEFRYTKTWQGLRPGDPEKYVHVPAWFEDGTGGIAAAHAIAVLIELQDVVDMTNYYTADTSPWSMFGQFGIRRPVFYAYKAFNELATRPRKATVSVQINGGTPSRVLAGIAEDNQSAAVLLSTRNSHAGMRAIKLAGVPWSGETHVEALLVDDTHALTKTPASVDSGAKSITVDLPPHVVCLIRLSKATAPNSQGK